MAEREEQIAAAFDITSPQLTLLTSIYWLKQNGHSTTQITIANTANMDRMTTSTVLRTLQKKGLVSRAEHETDTRAKTVALTDEGIRVTVAALNEVNSYNISYFSALGAAQKPFIEQLLVLLEKNKQ